MEVGQEYVLNTFNLGGCMSNRHLGKIFRHGNMKIHLLDTLMIQKSKLEKYINWVHGDPILLLDYSLWMVYSGRK